MAGIFHLLPTLYLVLMCTATGLTAPPPGPEPPQPTLATEDRPTSSSSSSYAEAVPHNDYTINNISATVEKVFADAHLNLLPGSYNVNSDNR